uniref:Reverse transcriptase domain-containing protein n=1 Tax=Tanacetum cinerariifolium TaxID=118510 RepID=A0A6L2NQL6_TANCI|nr:reverse transcriptase domain-containing protein [Tanacetum cinerariifolium]
MIGNYAYFSELNENIIGRIKFGDGSCVRIKGKDCVEIKQERYARKILKEVGMEDCNATLYPMEKDLKLSKAEDEQEVEATQYQKMVGCLRYILHTRLDLTHSVGVDIVIVVIMLTLMMDEALMDMFPISVVVEHVFGENQRVESLTKALGHIRFKEIRSLLGVQELPSSTQNYSNQPQKESVNLINIFNVSSEDYLEDLFPKRPSGNPTFLPHSELTSPEVTNDIFDSEGCNVLSEKWPDLDSIKDLHPHFYDNPLSGSTTYSFSSNSSLEEFTDELALITYPLEYDDNLQFDIEFDLQEIEFLLYHDKDFSLKDSIDQKDPANLAAIFVDPIPEMFTDEHASDYSSPLIFDVYDDEFLEVESDSVNIYDDPFDSNGEKIKEFTLLIDELDLPCDFLLPSEYDLFNSQDFSRVDVLPSTNNEDKVFNPGILIQEKPVEIITRVVQDKKLAISNTSLVFEDFDPPFYEPLFFKVGLTETAGIRLTETAGIRLTETAGILSILTRTVLDCIMKVLAEHNENMRHGNIVHWTEHEVQLPDIDDQPYSSIQESCEERRIYYNMFIRLLEKYAFLTRLQIINAQWKDYSIAQSQMAYGAVLDALDEYLQMGATTVLTYKAQFSRGDHWPDPFILLEAIASQDFWIWHAFFGVSGVNNDVNILRQSSIFNDLKSGRAPDVPFMANNEHYKRGYYLSDRILRDVATWTIGCNVHMIILHNMIIHDNGEAISPDYFPEEQHREDDPARTHEESMQVTQEIINRTTHLSLKADLVKHIRNNAN